MRELEYLRRACHQLSRPAFGRPEELVAWMGAVQAQEYTMAKWAVGVRLQEGRCTAVDKALQEGKIVRTHIMRPTWHYVAGEDLHWMLQLSSERVRKAIDGWVKGSGLDIPESDYSRCNDLLGRMLEGKHHLSREEIETELGRAGMAVADDRTKRYLLRAELEGIVCSGGDKQGKPTYALLYEQVGPGRSLSREEALAELAGRYFRSHSPAGIADFAWWSGLPLTEARRAAGLLEGKLIREKFGEKEFWVHESCREEEAEEAVCFLPPFDEYLIAYKDRASVLDPEYFPKAFNKWGIFYPVILCGGRLAGNWSKSVKRGRMVFTVTWFGNKPAAGKQDVEKAAKRYAAFCFPEGLPEIGVEYRKE